MTNEDNDSVLHLAIGFSSDPKLSQQYLLLYVTLDRLEYDDFSQLDDVGVTPQCRTSCINDDFKGDNDIQAAQGRVDDTWVYAVGANWDSPPLPASFTALHSRETRLQYRDTRLRRRRDKRPAVAHVLTPVAAAA